jgi:hypothetical protein
MLNYTASYGNSYALLVAVDDYHHLNSLETAVRGARAVEELLKKTYGFEVKLLLNEHATRENILGWFTSLVHFSNDRILFYFAGHGVKRPLQDRNDDYLALPHLDIHKPQTFLMSLKMGDLIEEADRMDAKHVLLLLDACYGGSAFRRTRALDAMLPGTDDESGIRQFIDKLTSRPVRYAISAGGDEIVDDNAGPDGNFSIFTHFLLEGLQGAAEEHEGLIRAKTLGTYLERQVANYSHALHKPNHGYVGKGGDGDFVFRFPTQTLNKLEPRQAILIDPREIVDQHVTSILQNFHKTAKVIILEEVTTGQSGSRVYLVDVTGHTPADPNGLHYCKIYRTPSGQEMEAHHEVAKTSIGEHIPKLVDHTPILDGWMASLYAVAHHTTFRGTQPLSKLIHKNMLAAIDSITNLVQMLESWNFPFSTRNIATPHALMQLPLRRFTYADRTSLDIAERVESTIETVRPDVSAIQFANLVLPNPVAFLLHSHLWQNARTITWPSGHVHGDLHSNNVMCLMDSQHKTVIEYPVIIDFDTYESNGLLLFDLAYLEIDLCIRMLPPDTPENRELWLMISAYLCENLELPVTPSLGAEYYPLHTLLVPIRKTSNRICAQQKGDFDAAFWIARASAGLNFARKRKISTTERKLVLLLAAHSLQKALMELDIEHKDSRQPAWTRWLD